MIKLVVLLAVFFIGLARFLISAANKKPAHYLLISSFIQTIPYGYGLSLYVFKHSSAKNDYERLGEFGSIVGIETALFFVGVLFLIGFNKVDLKSFTPKRNPAIYLVLFFLTLSILNPYNQFKSATFVLLSLSFQLLLFLSMIKANFSRDVILKGTFDGLMVTTFLEMILSICYPLLGLESVASLFRGEEALEWANRREGYLSAIGTFGHPGLLALFSLFSIVFFVACYFNGYKTKISFYLSAINIFIIALTFSRASYITLLAVLIVLYVNHRQRKSIFSMKNILVFIGLFAVALVLFYFSPLSDLFLGSEAELQYGNRFAHWVLGYQIWQSSPLIGIGINSHVYQMMNMPLNFEMDTMFTFLISNPIHNTHMIILAETGVIGLAAWFYFFYTRIHTYSKNSHSANRINNIFNMSYSGVLLAFFIYGFFGWAPFDKVVFVLLIFLGFFSDSIPLKKSIKRHEEAQYH